MSGIKRLLLSAIGETDESMKERSERIRKKQKATTQQKRKKAAKPLKAIPKGRGRWTKETAAALRRRRRALREAMGE